MTEHLTLKDLEDKLPLFEDVGLEAVIMANWDKPYEGRTTLIMGGQTITPTEVGGVGGYYEQTEPVFFITQTPDSKNPYLASMTDMEPEPEPRPDPTANASFPDLESAVRFITDNYKRWEQAGYIVQARPRQ